MMLRQYLLLALFCCGLARAGDADWSDEKVYMAYAKSYRYEASQNYSDAIKALLVLHAAYPQGYTLNLRLGWLHYLSGKYASAARYYQQAISTAPASVEAKLGYMLPLLAQEKYSDVESLANQIVKVDYCNYYANLRLAVALRKQDKLDQADQVLTRMLYLYPTDVSYLTELALLRLAQDKGNAAKLVFKDILVLDPENVTANKALNAE